MKTAVLAIVLALLGWLALPVQAAEGVFVRWSVFNGGAADARDYNERLRAREGVLAVYGGEDENGVARYLEIYADEASCRAADEAVPAPAERTKLLAADPFVLGSKDAGTADRARMALLVIDPDQLDAYKASLAEEIRASVEYEPGVLAILATTERANPHIFHLLELYADEDAYRAHIAGPYFQKYNGETAGMIDDKVLIVNKPEDVTLTGEVF